MFPPGSIVAEDGTPHHGWTTQLLPYLDYPHIYGQIDMNVPWNAPANANAFRTPLPVLIDPSITPVAMTDANGYGVSHYAGNALVLAPNQGMHLSEMKDGTSNTVLAGGAFGNYQPWGSPGNVRDLTAGLNTSPDGFGSQGKRGTALLFADGSVRMVGPDVNINVLKAIATPAGGEDVSGLDIP
jgi:hypothetical protein